jgi:Apoptosis antagonizing transcription factor
VKVREMQQARQKNQITKDKDIQKSLKQIEREDREMLKRTQGNLEEERKKGQSVRHQIEIFRELGLVRIQMQKTLEQSKRLPGRTFIEECSLRAQMNIKYFQVQLLRNLDLLLKIRSSYLENLKGEGKREESVMKSYLKELGGCLRSTRNEAKKEKFAAKYELNLERLLEDQSQREELVKGQVEEEVIRWSQKTHLAAQNNQILKKNNMGMLMQTPIGQVQKAMRDYEKLLEKSRLKRDALRVIGRGQENLGEMSDPNIYDDMDLYTQLVKEEIVAENIGEDDQQ